MDEKKYVVNVKITVCLEPSGPCTLTWDVFKDMYLPKLGCDWQIDFSGMYVLPIYVNIRFGFVILSF